MGVHGLPAGLDDLFGVDGLLGLLDLCESRVGVSDLTGGVGLTDASQCMECLDIQGLGIL